LLVRAWIDGTFRTSLSRTVCAIRPLAASASGDRGSRSNTLNFPPTTCPPA
jgi:hypothetical protein